MPVRPITDTLRLLEGGTLIDSLSEKLNNLVKHVYETGKPGEIILKLKVKRVSGSALGITPTVEVKVPKEKPDETLLYATPDGNLTTEHPKQRSLELQAVANDRPEKFQAAS
jgi:hypothetical protein